MGRAGRFAKTIAKSNKYRGDKNEPQAIHKVSKFWTMGLAIFGCAADPIRSVRSERYKYIQNPNHQTVFYNVVSTKPNELLQTWKEIGKNNPAVAARARFYHHRPAEELYDLEYDPYELNNIADHPDYAKIKGRLIKELERWMQQQGDKGNATELMAIERQGPNRKWTPYDPNRSPKPKKTRKNAN